MKIIHALIGGLAGACAVTVLHQIIKSKDEEAPRMDLLGMESLTKVLNKTGIDVPDDDTLYYLTMGGDIVSNTLYYSMTGMGEKKTWLKGSGLGLLAGLGAVLLPKPLGLNPKHSNYTTKTRLLSVLYYFTGGLVSSGVIQLLGRNEEHGLKTKVTDLKKALHIK